MKIVLYVNSVFWVHVNGIDTDSLTEQQEKEQQEQEWDPVLTP